MPSNNYLRGFIEEIKDMPNRKTAPPIRPIERLDLPPVEIITLDNGLPVYLINLGTQEALKLELVYFAGRPYEQKQMVARATTSLLKEGTRQHSSAQIAETFDFYGSTLSIPQSLDTANLAFYSLNRHFAKVLPLLTEILTEPTFPEQELASFILRNQKNLREDLAKNEVLAYRKITELIFGESHPYGYNSTPETYGALNRDDLEAHFQRCFTIENSVLFLSGKIDDKIIGQLNKHLGQLDRKGRPTMNVLPEIPRNPAKVRIDHPGTVQSAIRIGCRLFDRKHPDFPGMHVLNTLLGGYFGSRLMANIREEKGYTYNIYSMMDPMRFDGSFYIGTEVGKEFTENSLKEIYHEMDLIRQEPVEEEELAMVRNYLLGSFLSMIDGPFNVADVVKTLVLEDLPLDNFSQMVEATRLTSAEELLQLAQRYLLPEKMWEVVVG
ncbi:MAG: zinc protease [Saprospiraceae bacterium]|nr:MAG: zinc protease [Saprospiraceae bacterium]